MENKTTTELLETLRKIGNGADDKYYAEKYNEAFAELRKRSPFWELFDEDFEESIPSILETLKEIQEDIKLLKRHKHDERTGDVMIRI